VFIALYIDHFISISQQPSEAGENRDAAFTNGEMSSMALCADFWKLTDLE
jgi:hypothetical protein